MLAGSLLSEVQTLVHHGHITGNELDLELPGDGNERRLELVVLDVVGIGRALLARHDLIGR